MDLRGFRSSSKTSASSKRLKSLVRPGCSRPHTCLYCAGSDISLSPFSVEKSIVIAFPIIQIFQLKKREK
jgi:hypothetical protein